MKEITRRLYTKPVMLGMAFLVGMALLVGLFVTTTNSRAAASGFPIVAGPDEFETTDNGETFHDFGGSPIPADFFGPGSQPFNKLVALVGVPLSSASQTDTIIQRHLTVSSPGGSTPITMTGLSLKSIAPITVTYAGGGSESWNLQVSLSDFKASTGTMTIHASVFDSNLKVWPKFTFTRAGVPPKVFDTGNPGGPGLTAASDTATIDRFEFEPAPQPAPTVAPAPCAITDISEGTTKVGGSFSSATASSSCAPITLTATSPWWPCPGFCKPPLTEAERWARHNASPPGTKKQQQSGTAVAE
jgi:hypothetical protein